MAPRLSCRENHNTPLSPFPTVDVACPKIGTWAPPLARRGSTHSVRGMLFANRLDIWHTGMLPPSLTLEMLRPPDGSFSGNPLLAGRAVRTKYIERMGTAMGDMIERGLEAGLSQPELTLTDGFVTAIRRSPRTHLRDRRRQETDRGSSSDRRHAWILPQRWAGLVGSSV